jgi:dTDP-4-dehydrorhamnose reductase
MMDRLKKTRVLITGYSGMLGKDITYILAESKTFELYGTSRKGGGYLSGIDHIPLELTDHIRLNELLKSIDPDIIVHCAAYVDVDACEKNKGYTYKLNSETTGILAAYKPETTRLIYISTDSVFDGTKGDYSEYDKPNPLNYYAFSKLEGERLALKNNSNSAIVRTNIYGFHCEDGRSLAEWAIKSLEGGSAIEGFEDVYFNPVYTKQLARLISKLISGVDYKGIINIGSRDYISKYDFLQSLAGIFNFDRSKIKPDSVSSVKFAAKRPQNTTLNLKLMDKVFNSNINLEHGLRELKEDYIGGN